MAGWDRVKMAIRRAGSKRGVSIGLWAVILIVSYYVGAVAAKTYAPSWLALWP